jgi:hypothetical protein
MLKLWKALEHFSGNALNFVVFHLTIRLKEKYIFNKAVMIRIIEGSVSSPTSLSTSGRGWSSSSSSSSSNGIVDELTMEADLFKQRDQDLQTDDFIFFRFYCLQQITAIDLRQSTIMVFFYKDIQTRLIKQV